MRTQSSPDVITADPRFAQVRARDKAADGRFVYAVRTTGVFCRPSCPARPAKPENMAFYATAGDAEAAGYRPCKRCEPALASGPDRDVAARMNAVAAHIDAHADEPLTLAELGRRAGLSPFHLQRTFKSALGVTPKEYHAAKRLELFKSGLRAGGDVLGATFGAGYGSTSRVYEQVGGGLGMTPSAYRDGGAGETIVYAVRDSALGPLMMAATERGVCSVQFGDNGHALVSLLAAEFPRARFEPAGAAAQRPLDDWMEALDAHLSRGAPRPDLPLDLRGTAFQIKIWRFLLSIPPGKVVSYTEIAEGVGAPRAVRAAAGACGANRIGVLIPCHRALRADGSLGGYRWGPDRKRVLLEMERRGAAA